MSAHAILSPSSAHRWLKCTPSAMLEAGEPDQAGPSAQEGTLAHAIAELKLRKHFVEPMGPQKFAGRMRKFKADPLYSEEMQRHTDDYLQFAKELAYTYGAKPLIRVEKRLDISLFVPDSFGTGDCLMIGGDRMDVIDFKYGRKVDVDAENNPQMMLYALGAVAEYGPYYNIETIRLSIFQPRTGGAKTWEISRDELINWGQLTVRPLARAAAKGEGELAKGDWCTFCRVKPRCRLWADTMATVESYGQQHPQLLSNEELGKALAAGRPLMGWLKKLDQYVLAAVLRGEEIPGWKTVEGRRTRSFTDPDKAFAAIQAAGVEEALLYERKPLSLTAVEKLVGKAEFEKLTAEYVQKSPGTPTLVPDSDPRPAYQGIDASEYFTPQSKEETVS